MFDKPRPNPPTLRFRRWSRKRNAAFLSLGRTVTIGCLNKSVTEASLGKQRGVIPADAGRRTGQQRKQEEPEGSGAGQDLLRETTLQALPAQAGEKAAVAGRQDINRLKRESRHAGKSIVRMPVLG